MRRALWLLCVPWLLLGCGPGVVPDAGACETMACDYGCLTRGAPGGVCRAGACVCVGLDAGVDGAAPGLEASVVDVAPEAAATADAPADEAPDALRCTTDSDRDGHVSTACGGDDCDDANPRVHGGQLPRCDSEIADSDCNGVPDAEEVSLRGIRCSNELRSMPSTALGRTADSVACATSERLLRCRACVGFGDERRCICWASGSMSSATCAP